MMYSKTRLQGRGRSLRALTVAGIALGLGATGAAAQVTESFTVSATLNDSLALSENTPLDFGTLLLTVGTTGGTDDAIGTLSAAGAFTDASIGTGTSALSVVAGTPGNYTVDAGVPAFTNVTLTFPDVGTTPIDLAPVGAPPGSPNLELTGLSIAAAAGTLLGGCTAGAPVACPVQTDATGVFTFDLGGSITAAGGATYQSTNTVYSGTLSITVART